ncbi:MAG: cytochrome c oxidase cbb3-type subunit 2 [Planctomycetota bacterium]|jgi:cytochrome c oxidase cbb3-type subunit 2
MERFHTLVFVAGIGCFAIAFLLSLVFPWMSLENYHGMDYQTLEQLAAEPSPEFMSLAEDFPDAFVGAYGEANSGSYAEALQLGRDLYVGHACWHCHSQYVRPVSNERQRWGEASIAADYQNALNQPHLWGTRRVGPDLATSAGRHTNDWQIAHLINPKNLVPDSVMPSYGYYFDDKGTPDRSGFALVTYLQWIGSTAQRGDL